MLKHLSNEAAISEHSRSHKAAGDLREAFLKESKIVSSSKDPEAMKLVKTCSVVTPRVPIFTLNNTNISKIQNEIYEVILLIFIRWGFLSPSEEGQWSESTWKQFFRIRYLS